jgi:hypothetical protein
LKQQRGQQGERGVNEETSSSLFFFIFSFDFSFGFFLVTPIKRRTKRRRS